MTKQVREIRKGLLVEIMQTFIPRQGQTHFSTYYWRKNFNYRVQNDAQAVYNNHMIKRIWIQL